jgi:chemotaxis-related protein WspB
MKVLVFHIGADRYALPLRALAQVLPVAALRQLPLAPPFVAGLMDLHGQPVPVIDLSRLAGHAPEQIWFDTRIILLDYPDQHGVPHQLGLLAEHVLGVETIDPALFTDSGIDGAPFLGPIASTARGMLQLIALDGLLPPEVRALLFRQRAESLLEHQAQVPA